MKLWDEFTTRFGFKAVVDSDAEDSVCTKAIIGLYSIVLTIGAIALFVLSFILIAQGVEDGCPVRDELSPWSIVAGVLGLVLPVLTALKRTVAPEHTSAGYQCCKVILTVVYLGWVLYGIDIIYTCDDTCQNECDRGLFLSSILFLSINIVFLALPMLLMLSYCLCGSCIKSCWNVLDAPVEEEDDSEAEERSTSERGIVIDPKHTPFVLEDYPHMQLAAV
eukprot:TRINITY_DN12252_c3_g2_i1.p5 TRINITY_DN12252_c3_g2~~TRINITY_DN12252_c3_g2_i1.p5  ORF type:complete len:221 (+),score=30.03 TRINITY_DN12252_c3_g2_i1:2697-3359(+)